MDYAVGPEVPPPRVMMKDGRPLMGIPRERRGVLAKLAPSWADVTLRKAQYWTNDQIAADLKLTKRTVSSYLERSKDRAGVTSVQELIFLVYAEYAPELVPEHWVRPNDSAEPSEGDSDGD